MLHSKSVAAPAFAGALLVGALLLLCGCVTEVGYPAPSGEVSSGGEIYQPPPPLPAYEQPPCPGDGYLWMPGYWAYSDGYRWVPGMWVLPPQVGVLWTPGYWGFAGGAYVWHAGYWGPHVGFYGGVHYGFGYDGDGYRGGRWEGRHFVYNRYVTHVDERRVHYTYDERVDRRFDGDRASYEGGRGGIVAYPTQDEQRYAHERRVDDTPDQRAYVEEAGRNPAPFEREDRGHPPGAATPRPGHFEARGEEGARATFPARENVQARPRYQTPPGFDAHRPGAQHPVGEHQGSAAHRGPAGRPQGRPAREKGPRPHQRDQ
jgi:hypothetical protein